MINKVIELVVGFYVDGNACCKGIGNVGIRASGRIIESVIGVPRELTDTGSTVTCDQFIDLCLRVRAFDVAVKQVEHVLRVHSRVKIFPAIRRIRNEHGIYSDRGGPDRHAVLHFYEQRICLRLVGHSNNGTPVSSRVSDVRCPSHRRAQRITVAERIAVDSELVHTGPEDKTLFRIAQVVICVTAASGS